MCVSQVHTQKTFTVNSTQTFVSKRFMEWRHWTFLNFAFVYYMWEQTDAYSDTWFKTQMTVHLHFPRTAITVDRLMENSALVVAYCTISLQSWFHLAKPLRSTALTFQWVVQSHQVHTAYSMTNPLGFQCTAVKVPQNTILKGHNDAKREHFKWNRCTETAKK